MVYPRKASAAGFGNDSLFFADSGGGRSEGGRTGRGGSRGGGKLARGRGSSSDGAASTGTESAPKRSRQAVRGAIEDPRGDATVGDGVMDEDTPRTHVPDDMVSSVSTASVVATQAQATNPKALVKALRAVLARWNKLTQAQQLAAASIDDGHLEGHVLMSGIKQKTFH